jgi:CRISPR-associated endoribonuclease Cas6
MRTKTVIEVLNSSLEDKDSQLLPALVPMLYLHRIISLCKEALLTSNPEYKNKMYSQKIARAFTFSVGFPKDKIIKKGTVQIDKNFTIEDTMFELPGKTFNLFISSSDPEFMIYLYNGLRMIKTFNFSSDEDMLVNGQKIVFRIKNTSIINESNIRNNEIVFKTNSPFIIEDSDDKPVFPTSENFENQINLIQDKIFLSLRGYGLKQKLEFMAVKLDKQVVKHTLKDFREHTGKPVMYLTGFKGIFKLKGDPEDLDLLYKSGFGNKTSQGFGMLEVLA